MGLLEGHEISWRFKFSRAPWWGGQFERPVTVIKGAFYKTVGGGGGYTHVDRASRSDSRRRVTSQPSTNYLRGG